MKTKQRKISALIIFVLCAVLLAALPLMASAVEGETVVNPGETVDPGVPVVTQYHCICGKTYGCTEAGHSTLKFSALSASDTMPTEAGNYYLTEDITLGETWNIQSDIVLCLNGYTLDIDYADIDYAGDVSLIDIQSGYTFTICDCSTGGTGTLAGGTATGITVDNHGIFNMYSGNIDLNQSEYGGGIFNNDGSVFNMYGGSVIGRNEKSYSGINFEKNATVALYGGTIGRLYADSSSYNYDLMSYLATGYAFYDADGNIISLNTGAKQIMDATIACAHSSGTRLVAGGDGTHDKVCNFKGCALEDDVACTYENRIDSNHLISEATCISGAVYYKSCKCGHKSDETFVGQIFDPDNHSGTEEGFCDACSALAVDGVVTDVSLSLDGDIGVNFYWVLADEVISNAEAYFLVTLPNGKTEQHPVADELIATPVGGASGRTYYKVTGRVAAKEMAENIKVELVAGNASLANAECSVRSYAERAFAYSDDAKLVAMMKAMLNYGAASQMLFGHNTGDLANSILEAGDKAVAAVEANNVTAAVVNGSVTGITNNGFSCILETKTTIRHYFTIASGSTAGYTFKVGETTVEPVRTADGTMYYVDIPDISATDLGAEYVVTITNGSETQTITASVHSYMSSVIANKENTTLVSAELLNTVYAMHAYGEAAEGYFI